MHKSSSTLLSLRRSKSTSSVSHTSHPSTTLIDDPVLAISAHQHALAAANLAFARAGGRENVRPDTADRASLLGNGGGMEVIHEGGSVVVEQSLGLRRSESQRSGGSG